MKRVYIVCHMAIFEKTAQAFMAVCSQLVMEGNQEIYILFSTAGGSIQSGITMYSFLRALPVKVIMHNTANVDSIGNTIFLAGEERIVSPHATFMFHGSGMDVPAGMHFKVQNLREHLDSLNADEQKMASIVSSRTNFNSSQAADLFSKARTISANDALANGIVHSVADASIPAGSKVITLVVS